MAELSVAGVVAGYGAADEILKGVDFRVEAGEIVCIIGPNGAGKSTLFNLITGHLRPTAGRVLVNGRDVTGVAPHKICGMGLGRSFQRTNIFPKLTVFQNLQAALLVHKGRGANFWGRSDTLYRDETEALLASIGLRDQARKTAAVLGYNYPGSQWYQDSYELLMQHNMRPEENKESWISRAFKAPL